MTNETQTDGKSEKVVRSVPEFGRSYLEHKKSQLLSRLARNQDYQRFKNNHELTWGTAENPISDYENMVRLSSHPGPRMSKSEYGSYLQEKISEAESELSKKRRMRTERDHKEDIEKKTFIGEDGKRYGDALTVACLNLERFIGGRPSESEKNYAISKAENELKRLHNEYTEFRMSLKTSNKKFSFRQSLGLILGKMANALSPNFDETIDDTESLKTYWLRKEAEMKGGSE